MKNLINCNHLKKSILYSLKNTVIYDFFFINLERITTKHEDPTEL